MKTNELIQMLATNAGAAPPAMTVRQWAAYVLPALGVSALLSIFHLGLIPLKVLMLPGIWLKFAYGMVLGLLLIPLIVRLGQPGAPPGQALRRPLVWVLLMATVGLAHAVLSEQLDSALWGHSWSQCPWNILALSVPAQGAVLVLIRRNLAPVQPTWAGFASGLLAGAVGATAYALSCTETSPTFVALWYSAGVLFSGALGALMGRCFLKW